MAFAIDDQDQNKNQVAQPNVALTSSAPGAGPASAGKQAPQAVPQQPFQNLQAYLSANAPQVNTQADKIAGDLNNQYGQIQSDVNKATTDFGNQVQGGYAHANPTLTDQAASNPSAFAANPDNVKAFQSLYNDTYTGPSNFESSTPYGQLSQEISTATDNAKNLGTIPGLQTYFQNASPTATRGGNLLDSVLLSGNPAAYTTVKNAAKPFATLNDYLNTATSTADNGVTQAKQAAQDTATNLQNQFTGQGGIVPTLQNNLTNQVKNLQSQASQTQKDISDAVNNNDFSKLTDAELSSLGLTRDQLNTLTTNEALLNPVGFFEKGWANQVPLKTSGGQTIDPNSPQVKNVRDAILSELKNAFPINSIDIGTYLNSKSPESISPSSVATPADYETAAALAQLTGGTPFLNPADKYLAGTATPNLSTFNAEAAAKQANDLYQSALGRLSGPGWDQFIRNILTQSQSPATANSGTVNTQSVTNPPELVFAANNPDIYASLTPEEQSFIDQFRQRDALLAGRGLGAY